MRLVVVTLGRGLEKCFGRGKIFDKKGDAFGLKKAKICWLQYFSFSFTDAELLLIIIFLKNVLSFYCSIA